MASRAASLAGSAVMSALRFHVLGSCRTTCARAADLILPHSVVQTPVFMPVGTQGERVS